jgi:hypothetical protein
MNLHEASIRQRAQRRVIGDLSPLVDPCRMQFHVHLVSEGRLVQVMRELPGVLEGVVPFPAALGAWPVAGGEGNGFVEEELLRISIRGHHDRAAGLPS